MSRYGTVFEKSGLISESHENMFDICSIHNNIFLKAMIRFYLVLKHNILVLITLFGNK